MTTLDELDAIARRAAGALTADAPDASEIDAALDEVKHGMPATVAVTPTVVRGRPTRDPRTIALAAAAAVTLVAVGAVFASRLGSQSAPSVATVPGAVPVTAPPVTVTAPVVLTVPEPPSTTVPPIATGLPGPFAVEPVIEQRSVGELLYRATFGAAPDQLGLDPCTECDPPRPFDPVVGPAGNLIIVDASNHRIVTAPVSGGAATTAHPLPDGFEPTAVTLGRDWYLFVAGFFRTTGSPQDFTVLAYAPDDLGTPAAQFPTDGFVTSLVADDAGITVIGASPQHLPIIGPEYTTNGSTYYVDGPDGAAARGVLRNYTSGTATTWTLSADLTADGTPTPLADGRTVVPLLRQTDAVSLLVVLDLDGSSQAIPAPRSWAAGDEPFVDEQGIVVLERTETGFDIVRYPLPS